MDETGGLGHELPIATTPNCHHQTRSDRNQHTPLVPYPPFSPAKSVEAVEANRVIFQLTYASTAAKLFSVDELLEMLSSYREKNLRQNVTGLLLYKQGAFMQALEGDEAVVRALFGKIRTDVRHHHVLTLATITITERQFPDWSMGFETLQDTEIGHITGYDPSLKFPAGSDELPWKADVALRLLSTFMQGS